MSSESSADRAAARLRDRGDAPGTILTALDGSRFSESALTHAVGLARALGSGLHLVTVLDSLRTGATSRTSAEARLQRLEALTTLEALVARLRLQGQKCTFEVREGQPSVEILGAALERDIDLIALAARPRPEREHLTTGSVLHGIVASGLPSLLVARGGRGHGRTGVRSEATYRRIAVTVDGSRACHGALGVATRLARAHGAEIVLVQVLSADPVVPAGGPGAGRWVPAGPTRRSPAGASGASPLAHGIPFRETSEAMRYLRVLERSVGGCGLDVRSRVFRSRVDADAAHEDVDLLVVVTPGGRGYGADARRLLLQAEVPVLALRARDSSSPVGRYAKPDARSSERRPARRSREWSRSGREGSTNR